MKKHLSVLMLAARLTIFKVIGLLAVMSGVQIALFISVMDRYPTRVLSSLLGDCHLGLVAMVGFVPLCVLLANSGNGSGGSRSVYTLRRLSVTELAATGWWAVYNSLVCLVFWLWEALTVLGLCLFYVHRAPEELVGPQTAFLACYEVNFLHKLIPLGDISGWVRNGVLVFGLGICLACCAYHGRHEGRGIAIWFMAIAALAGFFGNGNGVDVMLTVWGVVLAVTAAGVVLNRERHPEEYEELGGGDRG